MARRIRFNQLLDVIESDPKASFRHWSQVAAAARMMDSISAVPGFTWAPGWED